MAEPDVIGIIIVNTAIGIIQEIRSKKTLDKLNILASPKAVAVRDGRRVTVDTAQLVRDDIVVFAAGNQIYADAVVAPAAATSMRRSSRANRTRSRKPRRQAPVGRLRRTWHVPRAADGRRRNFLCFAPEQASAAKAAVGDDALAAENLVKWIGIIVIPLGVVMFIKEFVWLDRSVLSP